MFWTKLSGIATATMAAALIAAPATVMIAARAYADCGDPGQPPCAGPVPTTDEVVADMAEPTDPGMPAANKTDIVTPGFTLEEAQTIDDHLNRMNARGLLPLDFVVTDIQPAPANLAGTTVTVHGTFHQRSAPEPIVLADEDGHWLITHDTAIRAMDAFWHNAHRPVPHAISFLGPYWHRDQSAVIFPTSSRFTPAVSMRNK